MPLICKVFSVQDTGFLSVMQMILFTQSPIKALSYPNQSPINVHLLEDGV